MDLPGEPKLTQPINGKHDNDELQALCDWASCVVESLAPRVENVYDDVLERKYKGVHAARCLGVTHTYYVVSTTQRGWIAVNCDCLVPSTSGSNTSRDTSTARIPESL